VPKVTVCPRGGAAFDIGPRPEIDVVDSNRHVSVRDIVVDVEQSDCPIGDFASHNPLWRAWDGVFFLAMAVVRSWDLPYRHPMI